MRSFGFQNGSTWTPGICGTHLDSGGARGGPEALSNMQKVEGRFDLFDAWAGHEDPRRAQIARGQELFDGTNANGRSCNACHNSANNGTNFSDRLFDIRTASAEARTPDLPLYTFRNRTAGETRQLTDAGRGNITGLWNDLGRFKKPPIRALAARALTSTTASPRRSRTWSATTRGTSASSSRTRRGPTS